MNGLMRKYNFKLYKEQLETMNEPIMMSQLPKVRLDLRGIRDYAKMKGVAIADLSVEEKQRFIMPR